MRPSQRDARNEYAYLIETPPETNVSTVSVICGKSYSGANQSNVSGWTIHVFALVKEGCRIVSTEQRAFSTRRAPNTAERRCLDGNNLGTQIATNSGQSGR